MVGTQHDGELEYESNLRAQLPGRPELWPHHIVVSADEQIDRKLASDLDQAAGLRAHRHSLGLVAGGRPGGGDDRDAANKPAFTQVVNEERIECELWATIR